MKIKFAPVSTVGVKHVSLMSELENKLNTFFQSKTYGEDLNEIYIGVITVSARFERFFKGLKPKYTFNHKNQVRNTVSYSISRALNYHINIDFERFNNASEAEAREILKEELLNSISLFDRFKNKIKKFDVIPFKEDMKLFFEETHLSVSASN